jgi:hypothetical protein
LRIDELANSINFVVDESQPFFLEVYTKEFANPLIRQSAN